MKRFSARTMFGAAALFMSLGAFADVFVVETNNPLGPEQKRKLESIEGLGEIKRFLPFDDEYLNRLYEVEASSSALAQLRKSPLVRLIEGEHEAEIYEIKPNRRSEMASKDMLYPFQWGLHNQEQIVSAQTPNGGPEETKGVLGADIGWKDAIDTIEAGLKKDPVVAVIDMGIDPEHPELKGRIYKNEIECDDGNIQIGEREDRDGNGLPGDCAGWNFAATSPLYDAHPVDDKGHGTHVSGIIAAKRNNRSGIAGVSDKIKILPVRVTGRVDETDERDRLIFRSASRRIAKGIFYAVHRGVDVINLSLGWPKNMNTNYMMAAISAAVRNNVLIVAAAGNNNSNASIYPCALREVVCVGSADVDGKVSRFSNHGGEVDILAPGDQIASTIPTAFIPLKLNIQGYDIMSGTSQAAPFVSAAAALIKASFPGMPNTEVQRRLFDSALPRPDDYKSMHGLLRLDKAFDLAFSPSVKPVFKQMSEAVFDPGTGRLRTLALNFKNFGKTSGSVNVRIESLSKGVALKKTDFVLDSMRPGEIGSIELAARVVSKTAASKFKLKVSLSGEGMKDAFYIHEMTLAKELYLSPEKEVMPVVFADGGKRHSLISFRREFDERTANRFNVEDRTTRVNLRSVEAPYSTGVPGYYLIHNVPEQKNVKEIFFFDLVDGKLVEKPKSLLLEDTVHVQGVARLDFNYDGVEDYLVKSVRVENNRTLDIQYRYLKDNLEPLYADMPVVHYMRSSETVAETPKTVRYFKTPISGGRFMATPVFINQGPLAEQDQVNDPWSPKDQSVLRRIYRFELLESGDKASFVFRSFMNRNFVQEIRGKFEGLIPAAVSADDAGFETIGLKYQSEEDFRKGEVKGILSFGLGFARYAIQVSMEAGKENSYEHLSDVDSRLIGNALHPVKDLEQNKIFHTNAFVGFLTNSTVNVSHLSGGREKNFVYRLNTPYDRLMSFIASYKESDKTYLFFETIDDIMMVTEENGRKTESRLDTTKFSFLPGKTMSDIFYPIAAKNSGKLAPAIYIDTTAVSGNRIYAMTPVDGKLSAPAHLSVDLPSVCGYEDRYCGMDNPDRHYGTLHCAPLNPARNADGSYSYMVLCKNKSEYELIKLDLSL